MKKYIIIAIVLIAAVGGVFALSQKAGGTLEVSGYKVSRADLSSQIDMTGSIEAADNEELSPAANSKVLKVHVIENQTVARGQILAELDPGDIPFKLEKLRLNGQQLQQELSELHNPSTISDYMSVKNKVAAEENTFAGIARQLRDAEENVVKSEKLYKAGAEAESVYKTRLSDRDGLVEKLAQAKLELEDASNQLSDYEKNRQLDIQAKKRQIASNEADIKSLEKQLEDTIIKSSIDGILVEFPLKEGRLVKQDERIRIYDLSRLEFVGLLDQEDAVRVKSGQSANIALKGLNKDYAAEVYTVKRYAITEKDSASLTPKIQVRLRLLDADEALAVGFEADASIQVEKSGAVLAIPREAVKADKAGQSIVYLDKDGKAETSVVTTGISDEYLVEIRSGLTEGDIVVLNPPEELKAGDRISANLK